MYLA